MNKSRLAIVAVAVSVLLYGMTAEAQGKKKYRRRPIELKVLDALAAAKGVPVPAERRAASSGPPTQAWGTYRIDLVKRLDVNVYQDQLSETVILTRLCLVPGMGAAVLKWEGINSWIKFDSGETCDVISVH